MATEFQTAHGTCPSHGNVVARRAVPKSTFPLIVTAVMRAVAERRRPYRCPICEAAVEID